MNNQDKKSIWDVPRPWSKEQIIFSTFRNLTETLKTIDSLPGGKIASALGSVHLSLNIFLDATYDLLSSINFFKGESERADFWDRNRRAHFETIELRIQRGIFSATMAAMALVDHSRNISGNYPVDFYQKKVQASFSKDPLHRFVQNFRNFMTHVTITKSDWVVKHDKQGRSVFFLLAQENLNRWDGWDTLSKSYIAAHPDGVNVEELFSVYLKNVKLFHDWFRSQLWQKYSEELREFFDCKKTYNAVNVRSNWNLLIRQVFLPKKIDPYMYLDRYLSKNEIDEVLSFPLRSKGQVDRIIEIIDEYGACDKDLRKAVYELFGVTD